MDSKIQTVQAVYEAFGRGDVPTILDMLTDDVDWSAESEVSLAPWHAPRHGKTEVPAFFTGIAESIAVTEFTPLAFASSGTDVMAVIRFAVKSLETGKSGAMNLHHWWRFRDGKICWYRGSEDTALTAEILSA